MTNTSRYMGSGFYPIRVEYFNRGGEARMNLRMKGADTQDKWQFLPQSRLRFPDFKGMTAEWFEVPETIQELPPFETQGAWPEVAKFIRTEVDEMQQLVPDAGILTRKMLNQGTSVMIRWSGFFKNRSPRAV